MTAFDDTSPEPYKRPWYARICCPTCHGPVRVRLWEKEGRCRGCRPQRRPSPTPSLKPSDYDSGFRRLMADRRRSAR